MQPDVMTAFLGNRQDKVKVFPTTKKVKPFSLNGKFVRRSFPFLMASAMVFTACSDGKEQKSGNNDVKKDTTEITNVPQVPVIPVVWSNIYHQVVDKYNLTSLKDKEPLSLQEIHQLVTTPQEVMPNDSNFNHLPENKENFWEIVKGGIAVVQKAQNDSTLTEDVKTQYREKTIEALSKISRIKTTTNEVDLKDYNNLHAFLFFEKLLKYPNDAEEIFYQKQGWVDEQQEFFGRYYQDHLDFEEKAQKYPGIDMFAKALYACNERFILEAKDSVYANALSRKMYEEWRYKQGIKEEHLCAFVNVDEADHVNNVCPKWERGNDFGINLDIDPQGQLDGSYYLPVGLIEIHEGQHVAAMWPKSYEQPEHNRLASENDTPSDLHELNENYVELGPTLYTLTYSDRIYKAINKIDRDAEVDYGVNIQVSNNSIPLGKIANWFGQILEKYPSKSIDKVLQEKEVMEQINAWGMNKHELPLMMANNLEVSR